VSESASLDFLPAAISAGTRADAFDVTGRVVVLTGGAGLLGSAYAESLSEAGAHVVVADVNGDAAWKVSHGVRGERALAVEVDVSRPDDVARLLRETLAAFGRVDALVNNAALDPKFDVDGAATHTVEFDRFPLAAWQEAIAVNLTGPFLLTQAFLPSLLAAGARGTIVNVVSTYGLVAPDQRLYDDGEGKRGIKPPTYPVTKAALLGLTRYLAAYYGHAGLRVNALAPGGVFAGHDAGFVQRYAWRTPLGRMARRDEYCGALRFLLSDAASYMTGACLVVDGGWTTW
jgi:2-deoxy-D-gluconate 3-dehydrogenase